MRRCGLKLVPVSVDAPKVEYEVPSIQSGIIDK